MLRLVTLAALAAALAAGPAAAESIRITTAGKSADQVKAEVRKAAVELCRTETAGSHLDFYLQPNCVKATMKSALAAPQPTQVATR